MKKLSTQILSAFLTLIVAFSIAAYIPVLSSAEGGNVDELNIYRDQTKQEIYGFGASIAPSANVRNLQSEETQKELLNALFGYEGKGAGFSLLRMTIPCKVAGEDPYGFVTINPAEGVWDFETYDPQRWVADKALEYNPDITFIASTWSPPAWMKINNSVNGQTELDNMLDPDRFDDYILYLATWAELYRSTYGYNLKYLSVQNEPNMDTWYESCIWYGEQLAPVVNGLVDRLAEMGLDEVLVGAPEGESIQASYQKLEVMERLGAKLQFIPTHSYGMDDTINNYDLTEFGLPIIQTEYNYSYQNPREYTIEEGLTTANNIAYCLNNGYSGFLYWYGADSFTGTVRVPSRETVPKAPKRLSTTISARTRSATVKISTLWRSSQDTSAPVTTS